LKKHAQRPAHLHATPGIRAPVAMGLARPLLSEALTAPSVHGVSGLDGPALPEPDREAAPERAPEQMARLLSESESSG